MIGKFASSRRCLQPLNPGCNTRDDSRKPYLVGDDAGSLTFLLAGKTESTSEHIFMKTLSIAYFWQPYRRQHVMQVLLFPQPKSG